MKKLVLVALVLAVAACGVDDVQIYDPSIQLQEDIENIEAHLIEIGVEAEVDEETGIRYVITKEGRNDVSAEPGDSVSVDYSLYNFEGELLDTSIESVARTGGIFDEGRTYEPLKFILGSETFIFGFQRSVQILNERGAGDFYIPSVFAYRNTGASGGSIAPNESLLFEIELLDVKK